MARSKKTILIVSASRDEPTYGPVRKILEAAGYPVVIYCSDRVFEGSDRFVTGISAAGTLEMSYNGQNIHPDIVGAAWLRKPSTFKIETPKDDTMRSVYLHNEIRAFHDTIWPLYPHRLWLNAPDANRHADRKLPQLLLAHKLGFTTPDTIISSDWEAISARLLAEPQKIIVKMIRSVMRQQETLKAMHTTVMSPQQLSALADKAVAFPGIYQPFLPKKREWRVTVVGDQVFPVAVYTNTQAQDDWRKHQATSAVTFKKAALPKPIVQKCLAFTQAMGLRYGAFDLIETPEGKIIFLECNANGQYGRLEDELGLPISEAIAAELMRISTANQSQ